MSEISGTVTEWLKPTQPLALWWQRNYPELREVSRGLAAKVRAVCASGIPVDTTGLRYFDYGLIGGAIDYRMRMEFTPQWGGDPERSAFTRAWAGPRGSIAHAAARLLADCAPALSQGGPRAEHLAESIPALVELLEERAASLDVLAPWDWTRPYAASQREEPWLLDYCIVLAELDNFYRSWGARFDFAPLLSPSGYRSAMYASGRPVRPDFWGSSARDPDALTDEGVVTTRQREVAASVVSELERFWPLFAHLCLVPSPTLEELAGVASGAGRAGRAGGEARLQLLRRDLAAQLALWHRNSARQSAQPPRVLAANPTFAGSTRLPADGDLIVRGKDGAGYLIDFKSAKRIEPAGMLMVLRQILTYALMDERDEYEIRRVGFYFTRYGVWAHWGLGELLDLGLGAGYSKTLDSHQQALRRLLLDLRQPQALDVAIPRR
jgi:hypothetical protein